MKGFALLATGLLAASGAAQSFVNPDFEAPALSSGAWVGTMLDSSWTGRGSCGLSNGNNTWGTAAHSGSQYAFIQGTGANIPSFSQTAKGFTIGKKYRITFWLASRKGGASNHIYVLGDDGATIFGGSPTVDGAWEQFQTLTFTATKKSLKFTFKARTFGDERAALVDDISIAEAPIPPVAQFANPSFEAPQLTSGRWNQELIAGNLEWSGTGSWGLASGGTAWGTGAAQGNQYIFLQSLNNQDATISQTVTGLTPGTAYRISFMLSRRPGQGIPVSVLMDGTKNLGPGISPTTDAWQRVNTGEFLATSDTHTFTVVGSNVGQDRSSLVDDISISAMIAHGPPRVMNHNFEIPLLADGDAVANPSGPGTAWSGSNWGIASGTTTWGTGGPNSPQYAYIQSKMGAGAGQFQQTFTGLVIGQTYKVAFRIASRTGSSATQLNPISVLLADGTVVVDSALPKANGKWSAKTGTFFATSDTVTIKFVGQTPDVSHPDTTSLIDLVKLQIGP